MSTLLWYGPGAEWVMQCRTNAYTYFLKSLRWSSGVLIIGYGVFLLLLLICCVTLPLLFRSSLHFELHILDRLFSSNFFPLQILILIDVGFVFCLIIHIHFLDNFPFPKKHTKEELWAIKCKSIAKQLI